MTCSKCCGCNRRERDAELHRSAVCEMIQSFTEVDWRGIRALWNEEQEGTLEDFARNIANERVWAVRKHEHWVRESEYQRMREAADKEHERAPHLISNWY
jgi:hypothetical protein